MDDDAVNRKSFGIPFGFGTKKIKTYTTICSEVYILNESISRMGFA